MVRNNKVLILDADQASSLDIIRSLGRYGLTVYAASADENAIGFRSRFVSSKLIYPGTERGYENFLDWLNQQLHHMSFDLVIPVTDRTVIPLSKNFYHFSNLTTVATEPYEKMRLVYDKSETYAIAHKVGVPIPNTWVVSNSDDIKKIGDKLNFPIVCKPVSSHGWTLTGYHYRPVFYVFSLQELYDQTSHYWNNGPLVLQEYFHGVGVGIEVLCKNGEIRQAFQHERLHELPITGGGSTLRRSVPVDKALLTYAVLLLRHLEWNGVAMVEFKVNRQTRESLLMEVNGRFWGSLPLSSRSGMNFAVDLYRMLILNEHVSNIEYSLDVHCRKLHSDINWFKENLRLRKDNKLVKMGMIKKESTKNLFLEAIQLISPFQYCDVQVSWDPLPGLIDIKNILTEHLISMFRKSCENGRKLFLLLKLKLFAKRQFLRKLAQTKRVLFVCHGNKIRSPFAAGYLKSKLQQSNINDVAVLSAGTSSAQGTPIYAYVESLALKWGVNLRNHFSMALDYELCEWADIIFIMDAYNYKDILERFPGVSEKIYPLGFLASWRSFNPFIIDPYGKNQCDIEHSFERIAASIHMIVEQLANIKKTTHIMNNAKISHMDT